MSPVVETNNLEEHVSESDVKRLHGEIIYEPNGFFSKIRRKDRMLNRRAVNTYTAMYKGDKEDFSNREEATKLRRENAQKMTNSFYDIVTDFYEYGKYLKFVCMCCKGNLQGFNIVFFLFFHELINIGWGESFHFARTYKGDTFEQSIKRHEQYLSLKLGMNDKHKTLVRFKIFLILNFL